MTILEIIILSVALAVDAMIVSFAHGILLCSKRVLNSIILGIFFGFFQFLMPLLGYYLTGVLYSKLEIYSKWIVFFIFLVLGLKFLKSAFEEKEENKIYCLSLFCVFSLAIATSIDALGAGISLKFLSVEPLFPSIVIGFITFVLSLIGFWITNIFKTIPSKPIEIVGSVLLIYLSIKSIL